MGPSRTSSRTTTPCPLAPGAIDEFLCACNGCCIFGERGVVCVVCAYIVLRVGCNVLCMWCMHVAYVFYACGKCVVCVWQMCCMRVTCVLYARGFRVVRAWNVFFMRAECVFYARGMCCMHVECVLNDSGNVCCIRGIYCIRAEF